MAEMSGAVLLGVDWSSPPVVACMAAVALTVVAEPLFGRYDITCLAKTIASTCFLLVAIAALNPIVDGDVGRPPQGHPFNSSDPLSAIQLHVEWSEWSAYGRAIFGALVLGWLGDVFLLGKGSVGAFLGGLVSFLLGHLLYIVAFVFFGTGIDWAWFFGVGAIMIPMTLAVYAYLRTYLKSDMFVPVLAYMFVFFFMYTRFHSPHLFGECI